MGGFNPLCNSKVNKLKKSGGVGHTEQKVYTNDGKSADLVVFGELPYVQIATGTFDLTEIVKCVAVMGDRTNEFAPTKVYELDGVAYAAVGYTSPTDYVPFIAYTDGKLYGLQVEGMGYLASVTFETIHPIDPKFIPGAVLPVVELGALTHADGEYYSVPSEQYQLLLDSVGEKKLPLFGILNNIFGYGTYSSCILLPNFTDILMFAGEISLGEPTTTFPCVLYKEEQWRFFIAYGEE